MADVRENLRRTAEEELKETAESLYQAGQKALERRRDEKS